MFYRILELSNKTTVKKHITKHIYNLSYLMATWNGIQYAFYYE